MSHEPMMRGAVIVEVKKEEYEALIRQAEKIEVIKRYIATNDFIKTSDIEAIIGIERGDKEE